MNRKVESNYGRTVDLLHQSPDGIQIAAEY